MRNNTGNNFTIWNEDAKNSGADDNGYCDGFEQGFRNVGTEHIILLDSLHHA